MRKEMKISAKRKESANPKNRALVHGKSYINEMRFSPGNIHGNVLAVVNLRRLHELGLAWRTRSREILAL